MHNLLNRHVCELLYVHNGKHDLLVFKDRYLAKRGVTSSEKARLPKLHRTFNDPLPDIHLTKHLLGDKDLFLP